MNNLNLVGNLTRDLEIINTNSGTMLAKVGLAVNKKVQGVDKTMFIDITFFGKTAEVAMNYLHKGSKIAVSGSLEFDQWDDANTGAKRSKHSMAVNQMTMLDSAPQNGGQQNQNNGGQQNQGYNPPPQNNGQNGGYQAPNQQSNGGQYQNQGQQQNNGGGQQNNGGQQNMNYDNQQNQNGGNMPQFDNNGGGQGNNQ